MNRGSVEFRQGFTHAAQFFEGTLIDPVGAWQIINNIETVAPQMPPEYGRGMLEVARRVREGLTHEQQ